MAKKVWTIHVTGPMTRLRSDGTPVRVPEGTYTMTEADPRHYEIAREGGLTFILSFKEIFRYVGENWLTIDGDWP
jgi:hypothetical protein